MLDVTAEASAKLLEYLRDNNIDSALRVFLSSGGCSGPALALALDEQKPTDSMFDQQGLRFLVEENLLSQCGAIKIDFIEAGSRSGFSISSTNPLPGGGGCSPGSCGSKGCSC